MNGATSAVTSGEGTPQSPRYYEGTAEIRDDVHQRRRYFTYRTGDVLVAGYAGSVMFTIDRPARDVWPCLKDFNLWQSSHRHYYSGVVGDLEGKTFRLSSEPNDSGPHQYDVIRVIPEHLIVISQPVPKDGANGGVSPGFHVFMLNEHGGKTIVTILLEHAIGTTDKTEEQAVEYWRAMTPEFQMKWRDIFIPNLKKLVLQGRQSGT